MPKECTTIEFSSNEGIISHNILTKYKKNPLITLKTFILSYTNLTAKSKKIAGCGMGSNFEVNNSKFNSVSSIREREREREFNQNEISIDSNHL